MARLATTLALVTVGLSLYVVPGLIVLAVTPYLLLAVVDGRSRPLVVNFRVIGARWWRWAITVVVMAVLCLVLWLLALIDGFFVGGPLGSFVGWLGLGLVASWFVCTWALLYRTVLPAGRSPLQVGRSLVPEAECAASLSMCPSAIGRRRPERPRPVASRVSPPAKGLPKRST